MYHQHLPKIQTALADVPDGLLLEEHHPVADGKGGVRHTEAIPGGKGQKTSWEVFPGCTLVFQDFLAGQVSCQHGAERDLLEINYCRYGRVGWNMKDGSSIYLGPGDLSLHTRQLCAGSVMTFPVGHYEGLAIWLDLSKFDMALPDFLGGTGVTAQALAEKFCAGGTSATLTGNEKTEPIFGGFYGQPEPLQQAYFRLKVMELLLHLSAVSLSPKREADKYQTEQVEIARSVHDYILQHMEQRVTIQELSQRYLINPTTLKAVFKAVYGDSLAAHMNEHRMEKAALLLTQTKDSIAQIAQAVGYESQSRFSVVFRETYEMSPLEYRKLHGKSRIDGNK